MNKILFLITLFAFTALLSCEPAVEYISIKEFEIIEGHIEDNTPIELLYSSATPDDEEPLSYFIHIVAVSQTNEDTFNILTTFNRGGGGGEAKNEFIYYTVHSENGEVFFKELYNKHEDNYDINEIASIDRVTYDKRFKQISKNNYPTVIGFINKPSDD